MSVNKTKEQNSKPNKGKWTTGTSGNPAGRPVGSRNKATLAIEDLLEGEAERLTRKAVELAFSGDTTALRLCLDRIAPPRKDRGIDFPLPPLKNVSDISEAYSRVFQGVGEGKITPAESEFLTPILELQSL